MTSLILYENDNHVVFFTDNISIKSRYHEFTKIETLVKIDLNDIEGSKMLYKFKNIFDSNLLFDHIELNIRIYYHYRYSCFECKDLELIPYTDNNNLIGYTLKFNCLYYTMDVKK